MRLQCLAHSFRSLKTADSGTNAVFVFGLQGLGEDACPILPNPPLVCLFMGVGLHLLLLEEVHLYSLKQAMRVLALCALCLS